MGHERKRPARPRALNPGDPRPETLNRPAALNRAEALKQAQAALAQSRDLAEYYENLLNLAALESAPRTPEEEEQQWRLAGSPDKPALGGWRGACRRGCAFGLPFLLGPPTVLVIGEFAFPRHLHLIRPAAAADITMIVMFLLAPAAFLIGMLTAKD